MNTLRARTKVVKAHATPKAFFDGVLITVGLIPSVLLGLLLNILDAVSYGFIIFPAGPIFSGFGSLGVSMFFLSTVISQLVYSLGGSSFPGAAGSMIIEVIPFFQLMTTEIMRIVGEENRMQIIATTMVAFALSSILTGLTFLLLGLLRLGSVIGFFPRHILVGCIGGVGVFLIQTGINVSAGMGEEKAEFTWRLLKMYFMDLHVLVLWVPAFASAVLLRVITHHYHHQLIFPAYFVVLPIVFYIIVAIGGWDVNRLRESGWIFNTGGSDEPWYRFYSYFDFHETSWKAIWATMPTQLALLFFNILHPPLNVPALGVSLGKDDVDLNLELTGHGVSNLIAGFAGVPSNYLAYVNTLLFYRVGGTTRYSGILLTIATAGLLFIGTGPIAYIPVIEVGALIFVLGIDLAVEAAWETRKKASTSEYITILGIMAVMTVYDFVSGVVFGIIVACISFVVQNSRGESIRTAFSGSTALSTVRRPSAHRRYLQEVGTQTCIMRLQGFLFFGTISNVEERCRAYLEAATWEKNPIRFLIIDLTLVSGLDLSAAEAFVRLHRLLEARRVQLVFCGQSTTSNVAKALRAVNLWQGKTEVFATLNEALEWTENAYIKLWFNSLAHKQEDAINVPINVRNRHLDVPSLLSESFTNSPRRIHVRAAGLRIMETPAGTQEVPNHNEQPFSTIMKTFPTHTDLDDGFISRITPYFKPLIFEPGEVVFRQGDIADGLYLIESGILRATYIFGEHADVVEESCVAGTLAGELTALAGEPRNATMVAERPSVLWKMENTALTRLEKEHPEDAKRFTKLVLKASKIDQDVLLASLAQLK
ncbi:uncharacterized protein EI90DRAFT_2910517 [Cantharellus anzutake]|uniref:uncharacterized protein n=1 Tax=Cantharellus anzutake TaxID=1750568 RepID=UPI00190789C9|nr:uncharacterized protein EI90DRAFT_2910517 [Cantharellus anzutake]KAF8337345.1 hypothetical protein EI90DRAFT_2910517 [Cantharellus anzutake]